MELSELQVKRLQQVGDLIRGDWSGCDFDGRDVKKWINRILGGDTLDEDESFQELIKERGDGITDGIERCDICKRQNCNCPKCLHESKSWYTEFVNEDTCEVVEMDFEMCKDCNAVFLNDKLMGYNK